MAAPNDSLRLFLEEAYGLRIASMSRLSGENENYLLTASDGSRTVFKLADAGTSRELIEMEHAMADGAAGLAVAFPRILPTTDGDIAPVFTSSDGADRPGRLLEFVDGTAWGDAEIPSKALLRDVGRVIAELAHTLGPIDLAPARRTHRWDLMGAEGLRNNVGRIEDRERQRLVEHAFRLWASAQRDLWQVPGTGLIHSDLNDENVLVDGDRVVGILDFGDALENPLITDLAIALAYLTMEHSDPLAAGAEIVAGYHAVRRLTPVEAELLFPLVCGRLAVSLTIAAERRQLDPERSGWFSTESKAWDLLERLAPVSPVEAAERLTSQVDLDVYADRGASRDELATRRSARVSGALSLSFDTPVKFIRGRGAYLFDEHGWPYLDLYNNVCHVGHCHPDVVRAGQAQMARLNTNTRYHTDPLLDYLDALRATLPLALTHGFVVNSGSEANELALRLARTHTGRQDVIVLENAYHGHTNTLIDISPYKFAGPGGQGQTPWVHIAPMPDGYRGPYKGQGPDAGVAYGDAVGDVIAQMERPPAAFIAESLPSVGGQIVPPMRYFETAMRHVRAVGGVCILDEVQVGFGRVGTHFWGFEQQGVVPDVVVMGKPIGNGHPLGVVFTTEAIASSFADAGMEFFSTFGGNPVSCAIGLAVLDVVQGEGLQSRAQLVGTTLCDGLRELMRRHPILGDVRGTGLFIGVELVENRETLEPATEKARQLVEALRQRRILTGTDGPFENVIKIKGPMVLTRAEAAEAIRAFDDILSDPAFAPSG
ncbi:MAG: aminotransferase class III-fold pyridoxal phosphate-dependent enzyme [Rubricoccaceae bacterium]